MGLSGLSGTLAGLVALAAVSSAAPASAAGRTLNVAPGGSDAADCLTPATACQTFNRGYRAAAPGDEVELAGGTYAGPQHLSHDATKTSEDDVVLRPAPGAQVAVSCVEVHNCLATNGADHVTLRGVATNMLPPLAGMDRQAGVSLDRGSVDVTFEDVDAGHIYIAASHASVLGGDYGPTVDEVSKLSDPGPDIVIDGVSFHDHQQDRNPPGGVPIRHMECIALYGAQGVAIRNSRFDTCAVFAIFSAPAVGEHYHDVVIENNVFSNSGGVGVAQDVKISSHGGDCSNFLVRNNTFADDDVQSLCGVEQGTATNMRWVGNIFQHGNGCSGDHVFDYNVVETGEPCGPHDVVVGANGAGLVDRERLDFRLRADSPAVDRGNPADAPLTDIEGFPRPFGDAPDAGAYEAGPLPRLSVADASAAEGATAATFEVRLDAAATTDVTVDWKAEPASAVAGDFDPASGRLVIPAGEVVGRVEVTLHDDALDEPDEAYTLTLSNPTWAHLDDAEAVGTIVDDDSPPSDDPPADPPVLGAGGDLGALPPALDRTAPVVTLDRLARALPGRVPVAYRVIASEPCRLAAVLWVARGGGRAVVGRARLDLSAQQAEHLHVRLTRRAARALPKVRRVRLRLELRATDAAGNVRTLTRRATLRR